MKKFLLFAAMAAILVAYGCNEERIYLPDVNADGRVIGTIQGVVADAADNTLLPGVEVSTTVRGSHVTTVTDGTGHYSFTNLDPGEYELTFIFPIVSDKEVKSAYAGVHGDAYIPTLDELDSPGNDMPNDEDFRYEVEANVELFPLNGGASGYVTMQMDYATTMPAEGVTVVADFGDYYYDGGTKSSWNYGLIEDEFFANTDEEGWYTFSGLPTGINGLLRTLPYLYEGSAFDPRDTDLILEGGGTWLAQTMNLGGYDNPEIIAQNWSSGVPFAVTGTFTATFNIPMNPATFTATLDLVYDKSLVPVTVTWAGNTVSVNPNFDLLPNAQYRLDMGGWSMDGQPWSSYWYIDTVDMPQPYVVSTNFEDVPFGVDDDLTLLFSEAMDPATFEIWFGYDKLGDILFDSTWSLGNTTLTIDPVLPLDDANYYYLNISGKSANGMNFYDNFYLETERYQDVRILDHNFETPFPAAGNVVVTFSEAMDPVSFEPFQNIDLTQNSDRFVFDATWSVGNTVLTLNPWVDFTPGATLGLEFSDCLSADGQDFGFELDDCQVYDGNTAIVVDHNIVDGEFPLDGDLEFLFSDPMAPETVVTVFDGLFTPIHGVQTWSTDYLTMTFNPDVVLVASTLYSVAIDGETAEGGLLDGGKDDNGGINGYNTTFTTVGGLQYEWNNLVQVDGSTDNVPVDIVIQLHFNLELDLLAENTIVTLYNTSLVTPTPIHMTYTQPEPGVLQIVPTEVLPLASSYAIAFRVFSYLPGDGTSTQTVFGGPVEPIVFTTVESPTIPVEEVADFVLASTWEGDYRTVLIPLEWAREPNATQYYVYARYGDEAKDDYIRVGTFAQTEDELQTGTVNISTSPANGVFDTRPSPAEDTFQTPYDGGREIWFIITAVNSLGEGPRGDHVVTSDISGPNGDFVGVAQDVSADDSSDADGEDLVVTLTYSTDEYLDLTTVPVITVTEEYANSGIGDPEYVVPAENISYEYEDLANATTRIVITLTVDDGMNAAGDSVRVTGFLDSSGNALVDAGTPWELVDATDPTGTWTAQTGSADNTLGDVGDETFSMTFTATELLDQTIVPTILIVEDGGDPLYVIPVNPAHLDYTYTDIPDSGFTEVEITVTMDANSYGAGDLITIGGLRDYADNVMTTGVTYTMLDTTAPGGEWTNQSVLADNTAGGTDLDVVLQFTCPETLDNDVDPVITITGANVTYTDGEFTYNDDPNFGTVLNVQVAVAAGETGDGVTVTVNGLTDLAANVQTAGEDWVLIGDQTAPADPANLVATDAQDGEVPLDWDDNAETDLAGYTVYRSDVGAGGPYDAITVALVAVSNYTDTTAVNGTQYWYAVTATDDSYSANESGPSNVDTATPVAPPK